MTPIKTETRAARKSSMGKRDPKKQQEFLGLPEKAEFPTTIK
jgi:hypothetical protein